MSFEVQLPLFQGPFDLLLFFIERDELDIHDIPISTITNDFLDYVKELEKVNIEVASEFILVAATLMKIKSKMLVPRQEIDEFGNEVDPREELISRLLEYKKYKSIVADMAAMEGDAFQREKRGNIVSELKSLAEVNNVESELQDLDLYKLLKVYEKVLSRYEVQKNKPVHQVVKYPFTISEQKLKMLDKVKSKAKVTFEDILCTQPDRIAVIFNFLAILELLQLNLISINVGLGYNNFWIEHVPSD
ncbi:MAG: ScpA family protein [Cyclobacteriaceae bacterium]